MYNVEYLGLYLAVIGRMDGELRLRMNEIGKECGGVN